MTFALSTPILVISYLLSLPFVSSIMSVRKNALQYSASLSRTGEFKSPLHYIHVYAIEVLSRIALQSSPSTLLSPYTFDGLTRRNVESACRAGLPILS